MEGDASVRRLVEDAGSALPFFGSQPHVHSSLVVTLVTLVILLTSVTRLLIARVALTPLTDRSVGSQIFERSPVVARARFESLDDTPDPPGINLAPAFPR